MLSATARSLVYLAAMARSGVHGRLFIVLIEIAYVTLTAGFYAGMQQRALGLRSRLLGDAIIAVGVPALAQSIDWLAHRAVGAGAGARATISVCVFTFVSALFHLHVMRNGTFLTGHSRSLWSDFRRIPGLIAGFLLRPFVLFAALASRLTRAVDSEAAL